MLYVFIVSTFEIIHHFFSFYYDLLFCIILLIDSMVLNINQFVTNHLKKIDFY